MKTLFALAQPRRLFLVGWAALLLAISSAPRVQAQRLPDLSGLAWAGTDTLLAVHDAKASPKEMHAPRVSLIAWPSPEREALGWQSLPVDWPAAHGPGSDLESVARVPGTRQFVLAESGANREPTAHLFLAELGADRRLRIQSFLEWPVRVANVEAITVVRTGGGELLFLYAERSEGQEHVDLGWASLNASALKEGALRFGSFTHERFDSEMQAPGPGDRLVTAAIVGPSGCLYVSSAHDDGRDDGPFRSRVWRVGHVGAGADGAPRVRFFERARRLATLDGLKVEGLAARAGGEGVRLVVGTDDEWLGAALRPLPPIPACPAR